MQAFLLRRIGTTVLTLFIISIIIFSVFHIIPGDPVLIILGIEADAESIENLREELGLDQPLMTRYVSWVSHALRGDLGTSIRLGQPVSQLIIQRLPVTGALAVMAILFAILISFPLGIYAALHRRELRDYGTMIFAQLGISIPSFWAGIMLMLFFAVRLRWFSPGGFTPWTESIGLAIKSLLLPAIALGLQRAAILTRMVRSSMLESLNQDYMNTARSKGLSERVVIYKHGLKNGMIPVLTVLGLHLAGLIAGSIVIEEVFTLPGVGRLLLMAISSRDFPLVQSLVLFIAIVVVIINFLVDLLYALFDPRIKIQ